MNEKLARYLKNKRLQYFKSNNSEQFGMNHLSLNHNNKTFECSSVILSKGHEYLLEYLQVTYPNYSGIVRYYGNYITFKKGKDVHLDPFENIDPDAINLDALKSIRYLLKDCNLIFSLSLLEYLFKNIFQNTSNNCFVFSDNLKKFLVGVASKDMFLENYKEDLNNPHLKEILDNEINNLKNLSQEEINKILTSKFSWHLREN